MTGMKGENTLRCVSLFLSWSSALFFFFFFTMLQQPVQVSALGIIFTTQWMPQSPLANLREGFCNEEGTLNIYFWLKICIYPYIGQNNLEHCLQTLGFNSMRWWHNGHNSLKCTSKGTIRTKHMPGSPKIPTPEQQSREFEHKFQTSSVIRETGKSGGFTSNFLALHLWWHRA